MQEIIIPSMFGTCSKISEPPTELTFSKFLIPLTVPYPSTTSRFTNSSLSYSIKITSGLIDDSPTLIPKTPFWDATFTVPVKWMTCPSKSSIFFKNYR